MRILTFYQILYRIYARGVCEDYNKNNYIAQLASAESKLKLKHTRTCDSLSVMIVTNGSKNEDLDFLLGVSVYRKKVIVV
jgi:hypothetical protein